MLEYPFEFHLAQIKNGVASITLRELRDFSFQEEWHIVERGNRWAASTAAERSFSIPLYTHLLQELGL